MSLKVHQSFLSVSAALILGSFLGCANPSSSTSAPVIAKPDVYVAGTISNSNMEIATYWKNGVATQLSNLAYGSSANAIAVSGSDVYAAGVQGNGAQDVAVYWKNGGPVSLTDGTNRGYANAIVVSNTDVYVAGGEIGLNTTGASYLIAEYWKNGVPVVLSARTQSALANSIFISGTDVYVAGSTYQTTQTSSNSYYSTQIATLWKNGVPTYLTDGLHYSNAASVFVSGSDVYIAGFAAQTAQATDADRKSVV